MKIQSVVWFLLSVLFVSTGCAKNPPKPLLMTTQLMYPGAFILRAALDGWLRGENPTSLRERAAKAYAANQRISVGAARGIFAPNLDR